MEKNKSTMHRIRQYDGYRGKPIWQQAKNHSVYYNYEIDKQCRVPLRNINEVMKGLDIL